MSFEYVTFTNGYKIINIYGVRHVAESEELSNLYAKVEADHANGFAIHHEGFEAPKSLSKQLKKLYTNFSLVTGWSRQAKPTVSYQVYDSVYKEIPVIDKMTLLTLVPLLWVSNLIIENCMSIPEFSQSIRESLTATDSPSELPKMYNQVLLHKRNKVAAKHALAAPSDVTLVWGKAHLPGISEILRSNGYKSV